MTRRTALKLLSAVLVPGWAARELLASKPSQEPITFKGARIQWYDEELDGEAHDGSIEPHGVEYWITQDTHLWDYSTTASQRP